MMTKFILDENISKSTKRLLGELGYDVKSVADHKMLGCEDVDVLRRAALEDRVVITQDLDFGNLLNYPVYYTGVIILRLEDQSPKNTNRILGSFLKKIDHKILIKSLAIVSDNRYRIRPLK
jgi:predicted nuclease of predicted toxin-antitoxin system